MRLFPSGQCGRHVGVATQACFSVARSSSAAPMPTSYGASRSIWRQRCLLPARQLLLPTIEPGAVQRLGWWRTTNAASFGTLAQVDDKIIDAIARAASS
jgi:hypothetical protein